MDMGLATKKCPRGAQLPHIHPGGHSRLAWAPGRWQRRPTLTSKKQREGCVCKISLLCLEEEEIEWNRELLVMEEHFEDPEFNPEQTFVFANPSSPANIILTCPGILTYSWFSATCFRYN